MEPDSKIPKCYKTHTFRAQMPEAESEGKIQGFNIDIQGKGINGANPDVQKAMMIQSVAC